MERMTKKKAIKILEMFLHKQCDLGRTKCAYDAEEVWAAVKMAADTLENGLMEDWIPCSEDMPAEYESVFARFKGTSKWMEGMFEKCSDDVIVTVKFTDGSRKTMAMHTTDGEWRKSDLPIREVIAWMPMPEPYKEGAAK